MNDFENERDFFDEIKWRRKYTLDELEKVLFASSNLEFFFNVSLSEAKQKKRIAHTLIITEDPNIVEILYCVIREKISSKIQCSSFNAIERPGEVAAILTSMNENDVLLLQGYEVDMDDELCSVWSDAINNNALTITVGKGPGARKVLVDLPDFTLIGCVFKNTFSMAKLSEKFEDVIECDDRCICLKMIELSSQKRDIRLDEQAIRRIADLSINNVGKAEVILNKIEEFFSYYGKKEKVSEEKLEEISEKFGWNTDKHENDIINKKLDTIIERLKRIEREIKEIKDNNKVDEIYSMLEEYGIFKI